MRPATKHSSGSTATFEDELDDEQRAEYRRRAEVITRDDDPVARAIDDVISTLKSIEDVMRQEERRQSEKAA